MPDIDNIYTCEQGKKSTAKRRKMKPLIGRAALLLNNLNLTMAETRNA
jgi:hypothetical protein